MYFRYVICFCCNEFIITIYLYLICFDWCILKSRCLIGENENTWSRYDDILNQLALTYCIQVNILSIKWTWNSIKGSNKLKISIPAFYCWRLNIVRRRNLRVLKSSIYDVVSLYSHHHHRCEYQSYHAFVLFFIKIILIEINEKID